MPLDIFFQYDNFVFIYLFICSDINECVHGLHKCSSDAFCNDTKGSYNCICNHGFTGNGRECKGRCWISLQISDKKKLTFANHAQRNGNLDLDPLSKKIYSKN